MSRAICGVLVSDVWHFVLECWDVSNWTKSITEGCLDWSIQIQALTRDAEKLGGALARDQNRH